MADLRPGEKDLDLGDLQAESVTSFPGLHISDIQNADDGSGRLFVAVLDGRIFTWKPGGSQELFLDIRSDVFMQGECGLLGLAFPPDFPSKQYFYVHYVRGSQKNNQNVLSRFHIAADNATADPDSEEILLTSAGTTILHKGGQIAFGPDGFLYIALGDDQNSLLPQDLSSLRGKILRIDTESPEIPYAIPETNPFTDDPAVRPEIWAYGLRNPWRFSFDPYNGDLILPDVGEYTVEEINLEPADSPGGRNYGWPLFEGSRLNYYNGLPDRSELTFPVFEYGRWQGDGCVIGGHIYQGDAFPELHGWYLFADYMSRNIYAMRNADGKWLHHRLGQLFSRPTTFGADEAGNTYIAAGNELYQLGFSPYQPAPTAVSESGTISHGNKYVSPVEISVTNTTASVTIRYTLDGSIPDLESPVLERGERIRLTGPATLNITAFQEPNNREINRISRTYSIETARADRNPNIRQASNDLTTVFYTATPDAVLHYTLDGSEPTEDSPILPQSHEITYSTDTSIRVRAFHPELGLGPVNSYATTFQADSPTVNQPYWNGRAIELTTSTIGAEIRYTLDGSEVTADSPIYRYPLILQPGQVLTARAMRDGYADSQVISRTLGTKIDAPLGDPQLVGSGLSGHSGNFAVTDPEKPVLYYSFQSGVFRFEPDLGTTLVAGDPFSSGYKNGEGLEARFSGIEGLVADQEGNIFLIDSSNRRIRKITPDHFVSTLAGNGNREIRDGSGEEASFDHPSSLIIDETGTLYLLDSNHLRSIHPTGEVSTLFSLNVNNSSGFYEDGPVETARFRNPVDLARDAAGNFYILDSGNRAIRKLDREGIVSTVAPSFGQYLSIDRLGNIYTMDRDETKKITPNGFIFTITWPMQKSNAHRITLAEDGRIFTLDSGQLRIFRQLDFDGDGIPDELETEGSGLTLGLDDSRVDSDGDGWTNSEEFLLGTNPLDADSRPSINVETATDGTTIIRWTSLPKRVYQVEFSDDLQNWFALAYDLQGTEGEMTVIDPEKLAKRFYRVRAFYDW